MSGLRVEAIKDRARRFLKLAEERMGRSELDIASFCIHQSCQLRLKAALLRLTGEIPRIHSIRELLGILSKKLEGLGFGEQSSKVTEFARDRRDILVGMDAFYTESRYAVFTATKSELKEALAVAKRLLELVDKVEGDVLG